MTAPGENAARVVRVVIADDHPMVRYGLRAVLDTHEQLSLVGEAQTGRELVDVVAATKPDVVITDLHMPDLNGAAATRVLLEQRPDLGVLILTMHDDDESVFEAMRAGARGYLLKGADRAELVSTVLALARGETVFGPSVARRIVGFFLESTLRYSGNAFPSLTSREREVLDLVAAGKRNGEIARGLQLSEKTVRNHLSAIFTKLQVTDRSAAIVRAREAGLGRDATR
ncbi:MAG TPA: response regulator transcription factor [Acidothermaceae bacterium]|nr:response regulator transcription factor [Acidothermaceae bacterium]